MPSPRTFRATLFAVAVTLASVLLAAHAAQTSPVAIPSQAGQLKSAESSRVATDTNAPVSLSWLTSYPMLLKYSGIPVLVPARGVQSRVYPLIQSGLPNFYVQADATGYTVSFLNDTPPPWRSNEPYDGYSRLPPFSISGSVAQPGPAELWTGVAAGDSLNRLPGLPVSLAHHVTGYATYMRSNGSMGNDTTVTWRSSAYIYSVAVPLSTGHGGRQEAITLADHMTRLTAAKAAALAHHAFTFDAYTAQGTAYRETVTLHMNIASLPAKISPGPNTPRASNIPGRATTGQGTMRGFTYRFTRSAPVAPQTQVVRILITAVQGRAVPGGAVTLTGYASPRLPAGIRIQVWWNWRAGHFAIHHYSTPSDALATPPGAQGYETLTHLRVSGARFTGLLRIPYGFHAPLGRDVHRYAILQPGVDKPELDLVNLPQGDLQMGMQPFTLRIAKGHMPWRPENAQGPYVVSPTGSSVLPPPVADVLQSFGIGNDTQGPSQPGSAAPSFPLLLPAWAPASVAQFAGQAPGLAPDGSTRSNEYWYALYPSAQHFPAGSVDHQALPALAHAIIAVFGFEGPGPYAGRWPTGTPVHQGGWAGTATQTAGGTLVRFHLGGASYGVFVAAPASRADAIRTARSMTEALSGRAAAPANVVLGYAELLAAAHNGPFLNMAAFWAADLWQSSAPGQESAADKQVDARFLAWRRLHARITEVHGSTVDAVFTGLAKGAGGHWTPVATKVSAQITPDGRIRSLTATG